MIRIAARVVAVAAVAVVLGAALAVGSTFLSTSIDPVGVVAAAPSPLPPRTGVWPVNFTLYGNASRGWGFSNATIRNPGPPLVVLWGTNLTLTLLADFPTDSAYHNWFIDYNGDRAMSAGEPGSPDFNDPVGRIIVWSMPRSEQQTGNWTYRCHVHPTTMTGNISIVGGPPPVLPRGTIPLITGIMVGALGFVLVFAALYHVRAVRAAKRAR